jgi:hypothetical protein
MNVDVRPIFPPPSLTQLASRCSERCFSFEKVPERRATQNLSGEHGVSYTYISKKGYRKHLHHSEREISEQRSATKYLIPLFTYFIHFSLVLASCWHLGVQVSRALSFFFSDVGH